MYTRSFDSDDRLKTHRVGSDTRTLTYDAASRITQTTDTNPVTNRSYDYDALDRLISQSDNSGFKLWGYDANSNRTTAQFGGTGYPYTVATDSNRLQNVAGPVTKTYSYDAAGNPLNDGATTFTWNAAGKLSTTVKKAKTHTYKYNALDQRISKNGPLSSKFFFFYDLAGQLIGEYRDNSSTATPTDDWLVRQETIWLEDIPVAVIRKATATSPILVYFIHADHLNTPRVIVNQSNTPVWRWDNTHAFGANLPNEDPDGNGQLFEYYPRFPGQYFDKETNLHYNHFRYYEPETGRYISPDPIGLAGGVNVWGYVGGNPITSFDSNGLDIEYANHGVGLSLNHSKIIITPNNQARYVNDARFQNIDASGRRFATLGAGPNGALFLESGINRKRDVNEPSTYRKKLSIPCQYSDEDAAIENLLKLANYYNNNKILYTLIPQRFFGFATGYNSNSFISGLGNAAGFDMPKAGDTGALTPGYQNPVPANRYE